MSTRNVKVEVNFGIAKVGEEKEAFKEVKDGFVMAGKVDASDRVRGMARYGFCSPSISLEKPLGNVKGTRQLANKSESIWNLNYA